MADPSADVTSLGLLALSWGQPVYDSAAADVAASGDTWALGWTESALAGQYVPPPIVVDVGGGYWPVQRPKPRELPKPVEAPPRRKLPRRHAWGEPQAARQECNGFATVTARSNGAPKQCGAVLAIKARAAIRGNGRARQLATRLRTHGSSLTRVNGSPWHWEAFGAGKARALVAAAGKASASPSASASAVRVDWSDWIAREDEQLLALLEWDEVA